MPFKVAVPYLLWVTHGDSFLGITLSPSLQLDTPDGGVFFLLLHALVVTDQHHDDSNRCNNMKAVSMDLVVEDSLQTIPDHAIATSDRGPASFSRRRTDELRDVQQWLPASSAALSHCTLSF